MWELLLLPAPAEASAATSLTLTITFSGVSPPWAGSASATFLWETELDHGASLLESQPPRWGEEAWAGRELKSSSGSTRPRPDCS